MWRWATSLTIASSLLEWDRNAFMLLCLAGHEVDLYAPRDLQIIKSASAGDTDFPPIILRSSLP